MKIQQLTLSRYGHFTDHTLDLGKHAGLTLIVGHNEAGKSTTRNSIVDLLFGMESRSKFNFLHNYNDMRLEAILEHQGHPHTLKRVKGNKNTLRDEQDRPQPESLLTGMLGGISRAAYQNLFALSHEQLRRGGAEMAQAKGDLGELLFGASGSLQGAGGLKAQLAKEVGNWHGLNKRTTPMATARAAMEQAQADLKAISVTENQWVKAQQIFEQAKAHDQTIRQSYQTQMQQYKQLQRLHQLIPYLMEMDQLQARRQPLLTEPSLDRALPQRWQTLETAWLELQGQMDRSQTLQQSTTARLDVLPPTVPWLHREAELHELETRRDEVLRDQHLSQTLDEELQTLQTSMAQLAQQLGYGLEISLQTLQAKQPSTMQIQTLQELVTEQTHLQQTKQQLLQQWEEAQHRVKTLELKQKKKQVSPLDLEQLKTTFTQLGNHAPLHQESQCHEQRMNDQQALHQALAQLSCWHGELDALQQLVIPTPEQRQHQNKTFEHLQQQEQSLSQHKESLQRRMEQIQTQLEQLKEQGDLPTPQRMEEIRQQRDDQWHALIKQWPQKIEAQQQQHYEALVQHADQLADTREAYTKQIHALERTQSEAQQQQQLINQHQQQWQQLQQAQQTWWQQWRTLWPETLQNLTPQQIESWLQQRQKVLDAQRALFKSEEQAERATQQLQDACETLRQALLPWQKDSDETASFTALFSRLEAAHNWAQQQVAAQQAIDDQRLDSQLIKEQIEAKQTAWQQHHAQWQQQWQQTTANVNLPSDQPIHEIHTWINQWQELAKLLTQHSQKSQQRQTLQQRLQQFEQQADQLLEQVGFTPAQADQRLAAMATWREATTQAKSVEQQRTSLHHEQEKQHKQAQQLAATQADLTAQRRTLMQQCGVEDPKAMAERFERARLRQDLDQQWSQKLQQLQEITDGWDLQQARDAVAGVEREEIKQQIQATEQTLAEWDDKQREASQARQEAAEAVAALEAGDPAKMAQSLADAQAEVDRVTRHWMAAFTAEQLFKAALERYALSHRGPVLESARHHFKQLTDGRFEDLVIDYGSGKDAILMVRRCQDHITLTTDALSDGTLDQLYLALRLAAVEHHVDQLGHGLPFIADDLFVHFDDQRTMAGLQTLAQLSRKTQVLLFTHHPHLAELAQTHIGDYCTLLELG
ncbi:AAA family ATPase [Magnetococcus sp. PR-3]|uniref:AAA family ATPase n=1 Tax=Magnetococcus sp. PR-3 TaxID=3120355 RepID=UPI002FCE681D